MRHRAPSFPSRQRARRGPGAGAAIVLAALTLALAGLSVVRAEEDRFASVREKLATCAACHGPDGASSGDPYPILAGQHMYYLYVQLRDFAAGRRQDPVMTPIAQGLAKEEMKLVATWFSTRPWPPTRYTISPEEKAVAEEAAGSAECTACHLSGFRGSSRVPRIGGQHPGYLAKTMLDLKYRRRANAPSMTSLMATFTDAQIEALARYSAALGD